MIKLVVKEVYLGHVVFAGGQPETRIISFDNLTEIEAFLRYKDQENGKRPDYLTRELIGVEL